MTRMRFLTNRNFDKTYAKLPEKVKTKFKQRKDLLTQNEFHVLLGNHPLVGEYAGFRSINITGNFRAIYYKISRDIVVFVDIGTHSQLYGK